MKKVMKIKYVLLLPLTTYKQQSKHCHNSSTAVYWHCTGFTDWNSKPVKHAMSFISLNHSHLRFNHLIRHIAISVFFSFPNLRPLKMIIKTIIPLQIFKDIYKCEFQSFLKDLCQISISMWYNESNGDYGSCTFSSGVSQHQILVALLNDTDAEFGTPLMLFHRADVPAALLAVPHAPVEPARLVARWKDGGRWMKRGQ